VRIGIPNEGEESAEFQEEAGYQDSKLMLGGVLVMYPSKGLDRANEEPTQEVSE
jgi:hypothetical protein